MSSSRHRRHDYRSEMFIEFVRVTPRDRAAFCAPRCPQSDPA
jgi:hypothetical protein